MRASAYTRTFQVPDYLLEFQKRRPGAPTKEERLEKQKQKDRDKYEEDKEGEPPDPSSLQDDSDLEMS